MNGLTFHDLLATWGFIGSALGREVYSGLSLNRHLELVPALFTPFI